MMYTCQPTPYSILNRDENDYDIFENIIPATDTYYTEKRLALWNRFHDTGIGNADEAYWIRAMKAKAAEIEGRYAIKFRVWTEYNARLTAAASVDLSDGKITSNSINRTYDPPTLSTAGTMATNYLSDQNRTDYEQDSYGGLESTTVKEYSDAVENPFETWAREFDKLFYWGL